MSIEPNNRSIESDKQNVKLLALFHYILAGITAFFACFPLIHVAIGIFMLAGGLLGKVSHGSSGPPSEIFGLFFILIGSFFVLCGWTLAIFIFIAGRKLSQMRNLTFCIIIAGVECIFMPFGTILGVFTIITLTRESVKELFRNATETIQT